MLDHLPDRRSTFSLCDGKASLTCVDAIAAFASQMPFDAAAAAADEVDADLAPFDGGAVIFDWMGQSGCLLVFNLLIQKNGATGRTARLTG